MVMLLFERRQRVLLGRFCGVLTLAELAALEAKSRPLIDRAAPRGAIADFSAVETIDIPTDMIVLAAQRPPAINQGRIYVVPTPELYGLGRLFQTHQQSAGFNPPALVKGLAEAFRLLGLVEPAFEEVG